MTTLYVVIVNKVMRVLVLKRPTGLFQLLSFVLLNPQVNRNRVRNPRIIVSIFCRKNV